MARIPPGELPDDVKNYQGDPNRPCFVVARKSGKSNYDGLLLEALQSIAESLQGIRDYYGNLPPLRG